MITVVTGLPRSGTSLMMQLLRKQGMGLVFDDEHQPADDSNPSGYFESKLIKTTEPINYDLLEGKAVKVLPFWLQNFLRNGDRKLQVIFMVRSLNDVLASRLKWRARHNVESGELSIENMIDEVVNILNRLSSQSNVKLSFVSFSEAVKHAQDQGIST
jgi:hypothetical protein